jgi:ectoine hydroxylase-related dioxygenase (phytanoyl-CoA dioxygenase family)
MAIVEPVGPFDPEATLADDPRGWKSQWIRNGYLHVPGLMDEERTQKHREIVAQARAGLPDGKDTYGYGDRIGQLHQRYPELMGLANEPRVQEFMHWAFGDKPVLFGSLNFDRGSQQDLHIDALFFCTEPIYAMAGLWVALEDVTVDAGPLFYVPGSHRWPFLRGDDILASDPKLADRAERYRRGEGTAEERALFIPQMGQEWTRQTNELAARSGAVRTPILARRGDVIIWHALLAHGGMPRLNPALSRHSVVYHFIGGKSTLHTFEDFFVCNRQEIATRPGVQSLRAEWNGLTYNKYDYFATYEEGREIIHRW